METRREVQKRGAELSVRGGSGREGREILYDFQNPIQGQTRLGFQDSITKPSSSWTEGSDRLG